MIGRISTALTLSVMVSCAVPPPVPPPAAPISLSPFRAPAVPLFVQSPYLNVWLCGDRLADEAPKLWNGQVKGMAGILKIDGKAYRFLGMPTSSLPALRQDSVRILPTRTVFEFSHEDLKLTLEFLSPMDPRDLRLLSLPVGLLRAEISATSPHSVQLYVDITGEWAVGSSDRRITWDGLFRIRPSQPRLFRETYNYPDWGEVHWSPVEPAASTYGVHQDVRNAFTNGGSPQRDTRYPRAANDDWPVFAHSWDLGKVQTPVVRRLILGHIRREIVDYFGTVCPAYWTRHYADGGALVAAVASEFESIWTRAAAVDAEVISRAHASGGPPLACLASLAFRQSFAANELALHGDQVYYFSKSMDISAPSAIQSLDVLYPASSALLAFNPALLRMQLAPLLDALARGDWRETFVMEDLGLYPSATGQSRVAAPRLQATAQLVLLSLMAGAPLPPERHLKALPDPVPARGALQALRGVSRSDLFVDRLLDVTGVPDEEVAREVAAVRSRAGKYGTPLDPRRPLIHADALLWTAAIGTPADREAFASEVMKFYADTSVRVPAPDRYEGDPRRPSGTQGRPVLGAAFAPLLLPPARGSVK
ncbi:MAG TPA: DUF5127 domain-containing protein [Planctomycetota bacterium]|nr:DUF5127 domain-containing protein [Planctomycetota bacterium]